MKAVVSNLNLSVNYYKHKKNLMVADLKKRNFMNLIFTVSSGVISVPHRDGLYQRDISFHQPGNGVLAL